jgi:amino acid permease
MDIAFAYGGQVNWMRYLTTMQHRSHFSRSVTLTTAFMTVVYMVVAVVGYGVYGNAVDLHK